MPTFILMRTSSCECIGVRFMVLSCDQINTLRDYINCEYLTILTRKVGSKTIVLRCFINCQLHGLYKTYTKLFFGQPGDGLHTGPKHVVVYYISLLIIIMLCSWLCIHRVSQEECARLRISVPYVKVYRYNPKHLYPKLNGYGDNGLRTVGASCGSKYCNLHSWCVVRERWWPWEWNAVLIVPAWLLVACTGVRSAM